MRTKKRQPKKELDLLNMAEIKTLLNGAPPPYYTHKKRDIFFIKLIITSGLRCSEALHLKYKDIDFINSAITVINGKGGKNRVTTLSGIAAAALLDWLQDVGELPPSATLEDDIHNKQQKTRTASVPKGATTQQATIQEMTTQQQNGNSKEIYGYNVEMLQEYYKRDERRVFESIGTRQNATEIVRKYVLHATGKDKIRAHDLRHAYASYLLSKDIPLEKIQTLLGHSSYTTTLIYAEQLQPKKIASEVACIFE